MFVNQKRIKLGLSGLLVIFLTLSSIVRAQQSQSQTSTIGQKQAIPKLAEEQPPANSPREPDDKQDAKLAVYQVHRLAEKILSLRNVRAKAFELARLASVLWKQDETHARFLFEKALNLTIANGNDTEARALSTLHRRVIALIAHSDAEWATRLIDSAAKREAGDQGANTSSGTNIRTARSLVEEDPPVAVQFAQRSLKGGVHPAFIDFVLNLRKKDEPGANRLFLQALNYLSQQAAVDITEFHSLGLYLFTAPDLIYSDPDARKITLVDQILVPNITVERPGVPKALVHDI